jgi:hypothetical protein
MPFSVLSSRWMMNLLMSAFGTKRTLSPRRTMSAFGGKRTLVGPSEMSAYGPNAYFDQTATVVAIVVAIP